jgi:hypothetical protein
MLKTHFCLPQFRHQHYCGSANAANLQRETQFNLPPSINSQHYWGAFKGENSLLYTTTPVLTQ